MTLQQIDEVRGDRPTTIIINGRERRVTAKRLSYDEVVALAFPDAPTGPDILFVITYRRGQGDRPEGTLVKGGAVRIKEGMIFNVTPTDKS